MLVRYATAIDQRDWALLRSCFVDNPDIRYDNSGAWSDAESFVSHMARGHERYGPTLHRITNIVVHGDDRLARSTSYIDAVLMPIEPGGHVRRACGRYEDQLVASASGGWRICSRHFVGVLITDQPA